MTPQSQPLTDRYVVELAVGPMFPLLLLLLGTRIQMRMQGFVTQLLVPTGCSMNSSLEDCNFPLSRRFNPCHLILLCHKVFCLCAACDRLRFTSHSPPTHHEKKKQKSFHLLCLCVCLSGSFRLPSFLKMRSIYSPRESAGQTAAHS